MGLTGGSMKIAVGVLLLGVGMAAGAIGAQTKAAAEAASAQAVFLSDLHLDPFHDPGKVAQLVKAPVEDWQAILPAPDTATQAADFAAVQQACKAKLTMDSPYVLFKSSLDAAKAQGAKFAVVSGDLLVHDLDCRYRAALH